MLTADNLAALEWLFHGFGQRGSVYPPAVTTLRQIHSGTVLEAASAGGDRIAEGDALVTDHAGMFIGVRTADCVPLLMADRRTRAVASVHAGWRGAAENIAAGAIRAMEEKFGSRPEDLVAAIGPSIGPCCYEVGPEVAHRFQNWLPNLADMNHPVHLDLPAVNEAQLREAGVEDIWKAGVCTYCEASLYFSFRREKEQAGRMLSFIGSRNPRNQPR